MGRGSNFRRKPSARALERQKIEQRLSLVGGRLIQLNCRLGRLGLEHSGEPTAVAREREALRRARTKALFDIDRLEARLNRPDGPPHASHAPGFRGIRSIVQGGSPGSGKRA